MPRQNPPRTTRTRQHVISDLSVNFVERQALLRGFAVQRRTPDYGLDLILSTYDAAGRLENGHINCQLKATDAPALVFEGEFIAVRIEARHFRHWLMEPMPVFLILYDALADSAHWVYIQAYFQKRKKDLDLEEVEGSITIHIPRVNIVDPAAMAVFARYRDSILEQSKGIIHDE